MASAQCRRQRGFTLIELMITVAIIGILASLAVVQYRDYTRRAKMSEVVLAATGCKTRVSESYLSLSSPPASGSGWGCDPAGTTAHVGAVQTSVDGVIRVVIANVDPAVNGLHMHFVPARLDRTGMTAADDLGNAVSQWLCGSDHPQVRSALPSECRFDTSPYAAGDFE